MLLSCSPDDETNLSFSPCGDCATNHEYSERCPRGRVHNPKRLIAVRGHSLASVVRDMEHLSSNKSDWWRGLVVGDS